MSVVFIPATPQGVTPISDYDRQPILLVTGGDAIVFRTRVRTSEGVAATFENSILEFALTDQRFAEEVIWRGRWHAGIERVPGADDMVSINVPPKTSENLRRGSYDYSLRVSDIHGQNMRTVLQGHLLVEYAPTSPHKNIPYKDS